MVFSAVESLLTDAEQAGIKQWRFSDSDLHSAIDRWLQEKINDSDVSVISNEAFIRSAIVDLLDGATILQVDTELKSPKMVKQERTAWPKNSIEGYQSVDDSEWGYLIVDDQGIRFDDSIVPSHEEILARWSRYFESA